MPTAIRPHGLLLLGCTVVLLAACSDDGTPPLETASMSAAIIDGATASAVAGTVPSDAGGPQAAATLSGDLVGTAQIFAFTDADGWVELGAPQNVTLALQSGDLATLATDAQVPAGTYTRVRLVLTDFHADVAVGSVIEGIALSTGVSIAMGGSDHVVQLEVDVTPVTVSAEAGATVLVDLHSGSWVTQAAASAEAADDAAIQAAATASIQTS